MSDDGGLLSDDFKDGRGILFIGMEGTGDKAKFTVTDEAKAFLATVFSLEFPLEIGEREEDRACESPILQILARLGLGANFAARRKRWS